MLSLKKEFPKFFSMSVDACKFSKMILLILFKWLICIPKLLIKREDTQLTVILLKKIYNVAEVSYHLLVI